MSLFSGENAVLGSSTTVNGFKPQLFEHITVPLAAASTSAYVFIAPSAYKVVAVRLVFGTTSTSGTVALEKLTGTQALGAGVPVLSAAMALSGTANTVASGTLNTTVSNSTLAAGDRIATTIAGTMTGLANALLEVIFQKL